MKNAALLSLGLTAVLGACGGDPLVGTWKSSDVPALVTTLDHAQALSTTAVIAADKKLTITAVLTNFNTTALAGCTDTINLSGTWNNTTANTLSIAVVSGTDVTSGCTDPTQDTPANNQASTATLTLFGNLGGGYAVSGNTLTVTSTPSFAGVSAGTVVLHYTRQ